jgi:predicted transcriptional regulator YdeE
MNTTNLKPFHVMGIAVRTTNENMQAAQDIGALWGRFMNENIIAQIPSKADLTIYSVYCEYEKDHTRPYTTLLGCRVNSIEIIPDGMRVITIAEGDYTTYTAKGNLMEGAVYNAWTKIWNAGMPRTFATDFEIYGPGAQNPEDAEVEIMVGVR